MEAQMKLLMQVNAQERTKIEQLNALLAHQEALLLAQIKQDQALTAKIDELLQGLTS